MLKAYADETDPVVWTDILLNINKLEKLFQLTNVYDQFKAFVISLLLPLSQRIGPESRDEDSECFIKGRNCVLPLWKEYFSFEKITRKKFLFLMKLMIKINKKFELLLQIIFGFRKNL